MTNVLRAYKSFVIKIIYFTPDLLVLFIFGNLCETLLINFDANV